MPSSDIYVNKFLFYNSLKSHRIFLSPELVEICEKVEDKKQMMNFRQAVKKETKSRKFWYNRIGWKVPRLAKAG
jgi:hypothetical protein